jgi:hypothetical protein
VVYVYAIKSLSTNYIYVGMSENVIKRFHQHNKIIQTAHLLIPNILYIGCTISIHIPMAKKTPVRQKGGKSAAKKVKKAVVKKSKSVAKKSETATKKTKPATKKSGAAAKKPKLAKIKTTETNASVAAYINKLSSEQQRKDSFAIAEMMKKATGAQPKMWGSSIIGFGNRIYESPSTGRQVEWMVIGFSPRKANITLYLIDISKHSAAIKKLGKHKVGGGCLYINKLADVDTTVLKELIGAASKYNK